MKVLLILGIIFLVLLIGVIIYVKQRIENFSRKVFGTKSIADGFQQVQQEYVSKPKSVAGMTSVYLPNIMSDFPDFHFDEMKERAERVLTAYLLSIHERRPQLPEYVNSDLKHQLEQYLQVLSNKNYKESFANIKTHDCQITRYTKEKGKCKITFQASVQYYHYIKDDMHKLISGSENTYEQARYDIEVFYIQDRDLVEDVSGDTLGINCPNCGAPITNLGNKSCTYCGTSIVALNISTWTFSDVKERA